MTTELRYTYIPSTSEEPSESYHSFECACGETNIIERYAGEDWLTCSYCKIDVAVADEIQLAEAA